MRSLDDIREEYEFLDADERYRLLIELADLKERIRKLEAIASGVDL